MIFIGMKGMQKPVYDRETRKYDPREALFMANLAQMIYPGGSDINPLYRNHQEFLKDLERMKARAEVWGFDYFAYSYAPERNIFALILANRTDVVIVFRGSVVNDFANWFTDLQIRHIPFFSYGKVHRGFSNALEAIWPGIVSQLPDLENRKVRLAGHSLGAALALLAGVRFVEDFKQGLVKTIYAFGQPRVGNVEFSQALNQTYLKGCVFKFATCYDFITVIPPNIKRILEYAESSKVVYFNREGRIEVKEHLSEIRTMIRFFTGYFDKDFMPEVAAADEQEATDVVGPEEMLGQEEENQVTSKFLEMLMDVVTKLFIRLNPHVVRAHRIESYIDKLKENMGINPFSDQE